MTENEKSVAKILGKIATGLSMILFGSLVAAFGKVCEGFLLATGAVLLLRMLGLL